MSVHLVKAFVSKNKLFAIVSIIIVFAVIFMFFDQSHFNGMVDTVHKKSNNSNIDF